MSSDYIPKPGTLEEMVVGYFTNNPDAALSVDEILSQFKPARNNNIHTQLSKAREAGLLARYQDTDREYRYKAGVVLRHGQYGVIQDKKPQKPFDPAIVQIEVGIPMPCQPKPLFALLDRMEVAQSVQVPLDIRHKLAKIIQKMHKSGKCRFTCRSDLETKTIRIWRTE